MKLIKIKETCLYVKNLAQAKDFYASVLELPLINYLEGKHAFFKVGSSVLLLFNPEDSKLKVSPPPHFGGGRQHFAFEVPLQDYEKAKEWIKSRGLRITEEVTWASGCKSFYFEDVEGNILEIVPDEGIWPF